MQRHLEGTEQADIQRTVQQLRNNDHNLHHLANSLFVRHAVPAFHYAGDLIFSEDIPKLLVVIQCAINHLPGDVRASAYGEAAINELAELQSLVCCLIKLKDETHGH